MATRKRITNAELLAKYHRRQAATLMKMDRAIQKVLRANDFLYRCRNEVKYVNRRLDEIRDAMVRGEEYPKERPIKKKKGRAITLD